MIGDFEYHSETKTLADGASFPFQSLRFLGLQAATGSLRLAPKGKTGDGPFDLHQVIDDPDGEPIGGVLVTNKSGAPVTFTVITSNKRIGFSPDGTGAVSVTIGGVSVTVPVSIAAAVSVQGKAAANERAAVADGAAIIPTTDLEGRLVNLPFAPIADRLAGSVTIAAAGVVDLIAAQAAGFRVHLTSLVVANDGGADNVAIILDGATELFRVAVKAGDTVPLNFSVPEHTTAATALRVNITGATSMRIRARGYKGV